MAFFVYRANHGTKAWYQIMGCLGGISSEQKGTKSRYQRTQITVASSQTGLKRREHSRHHPNAVVMAGMLMFQVSAMTVAK